MDTMYRKKTREAEEAASSLAGKREEAHVADSYSPKVRPRETHPDTVDADQRISKNLNKLNRRLLETPAAEAKAEEDRGAKVVTRATARTKPVPLAMIVSCVLIAAVFMYMLSLYVQIEEYSHSIDTMESEIAGMKEEVTQLEVQLENKYDLDEVERIATQEYGMVAASTLPKKYVSVTEEKEVWQEVEEEEKSLWDRLFGK
ncbi:MAG: hypothetical protein IKC69_07280 [Clostridia bacterium]|nr:hypothetical protein [Clostridia bacterium]